MTFIEIFLIGIALSMDAFSVSICKGLTTKKFSWRMAVKCGLWFGGFQALMPIIGYYLGISFQALIESVDHWIAFGLLFLIGANMIREAIWGKDEEKDNGSLDFKTMLLLAIATSIDAFVVGIGFGLHSELAESFFTCLIIGIVTFAAAMIGIMIGRMKLPFNERIATIIGGLVLIGLGTKTLIEHLGLLN